MCYNLPKNYQTCTVLVVVIITALPQSKTSEKGRKDSAATPGSNAMIGITPNLEASMNIIFDILCQLFAYLSATRRWLMKLELSIITTKLATAKDVMLVK